MRLVEFLKSPRFIIHLALSILLGAGIIWATLRFLDWYTLHGQSVTVPDLTGLKAQDVEKILPEKKLKFEIVDSIYDSNRPKGVVIAQDPLPESQVKENRTIYLTVNSFNPPSVAMPRLVDRSLREVQIILENMGLRMNDPKFIPDMCKNCVLKQLVKGKEIEEGTMVPKGTYIDLVVGMGISDEKIRVPLLIGLTLDSVLAVLQQHYLNLGAEIYDTETVFTMEDSMNAKVYSQDPAYSPSALIPLGSSVNLRFTRDPEKIDTILRNDYVPDNTIYNSSDNDSLFTD